MGMPGNVLEYTVRRRIFTAGWSTSAREVAGKEEEETTMARCFISGAVFIMIGRLISSCTDNTPCLALSPSHRVTLVASCSGRPPPIMSYPESVYGYASGG